MIGLVLPPHSERSVRVLDEIENSYRTSRNRPWCHGRLARESRARCACHVRSLCRFRCWDSFDAFVFSSSSVMRVPEVNVLL